MSTVFISYTTQDSPFVKRLARDLEKQGLTIWAFEERLRPGASIVDEISRALTQSEYAIVVLSPDSVNSEWVQFEIDLALGNKLATGGSRPVPVLVRDCPVPPKLSSVFYADFRGGYQSGLSKLLSAFPARPPGTAPQTPPTQPRGGANQGLTSEARDKLLDVAMRVGDDGLQSFCWAHALPRARLWHSTTEATAVAVLAYLEDRDMLSVFGDWIRRKEPALKHFLP